MGKPRGRPPKENKTTNAERCKAYRNKHKESYKVDDALRKRISREQIKLKPAENRLRLQRQAAAKRAQRQRKNYWVSLIFFHLKNYFQLVEHFNFACEELR